LYNETIERSGMAMLPKLKAETAEVLAKYLGKM